VKRGWSLRTRPAGGKSSLSAANGILYQLSGSTEISGGENKVLGAGEALFVAAGRTASLSAAHAPAKAQ
jgi:hypothetical protein